MKILNLTDLEKSDIKYQIQQFPDGQQNCLITDTGWVNLFIPVNTIVKIKSRFNSFRDLELIICVTKALRRMGVKEIHLYIPYLLGARSDRQFQEGGNSYLVDIIAPIINSLEFESVTVMDIHSDVAAACINNLKSLNNMDLVNFTLNQLYPHGSPVEKDCPFILVSSDAGSLKKIYKLSDSIGYEGDIICCSKSRDVDGNLSKVNVPISIEDTKKDIIIIDDICDGGATFINIAKCIKSFANSWKTDNLAKKYPTKIYLIITHGIFSKGFDELSQYFDGIYCTNSYKDLLKDNNLLNKSIEMYTNKKNLIKQLNVF